MDLKLVLVLLSLQVSTGLAVPFQWTFLAATTTPAPPPARWQAGVAYNGGFLYVFGGRGVDGKAKGDTWRFDTGSVMWSEVDTSVSPPPPRYGYVGGVTTMDGDTVWVISYGHGSDGYLDSTWYFDFAMETWSEMSINTTEDTPRVRLEAAGGVYPGSDLLWLSMGQGDGDRKLSDTWVLNISSGLWEEVDSGGGLNQYNPLIPHARSSHAGSPISPDSFVIFGGCSAGGQVGGPCPLDDSWMIDLQDREWEQLPRCPAPRNRAGMLPSLPGRAVMWGGDDNTGPGVFPQKLDGPSYEASEINVVDMDGDDWRVYTSTAASSSFPARRESPHFAVDVASGNIYMFGGKTVGSDDVLLHDVWLLSGDGEGSSDDGCPSPTFSFLHLHGVLMYAAWGLLLPLGVLLGRYYRWTWPCWFVLHIIFQSGAVLLTVAGFVVVFLVGSDEPNFAHAIVGIVLTAILIQQYLSGIFHPCAEKEDGRTPSDEKGLCRKCWEIYHGTSGFITAAIGLGQVTLGVLLIAPPLEVWVTWSVLGGLWIIVFAVHEVIFLACKVRRTKED